MGWLDELVKSMEENEAPERYVWWSGLATISAVVRKNIWIDRSGYHKTYPNIYVALISPKSGGRKGAAISMAQSLLESASLTRVISGCNSIQGIIEELGQQKTLSNGTIITEAHGILLSDELDSFLTDDPKALSYLTALYSPNEHEKSWDKTLKSGKTSLKSPCLSLLVASNEILLGSVIKRKDMEGGFVGRTMLVKEGRSAKVNPLIDPPNNPINYDKLALRLLEISKLKGRFIFTNSARALFIDWYTQIRNMETDDVTGTYERLGDHALKVAMLISLSKKDELLLEYDEIQLAIRSCTECAETAADITPSSEATNGDKPNVMKLVRDCILDSSHEGIKYKTTKAALLRRLQRYSIFTTQLDVMVKELISAGWITRTILPGNGNINARTILSITEEGCIEFLKDKARVDQYREH